MTTLDTEREMAELLITALNLEHLKADELDAEARLFGQSPGSWGLDSIDALEMSLAIQQKYGVELRSDDPGTRTAFASLRALTAHVLAQRK